MSDLLEAVRHEIVDVHRFFVDWYNGSADPDALEERLAPRMDPDFLIIAPDGKQTNLDDLMAHFRSAYGGNPAFRIAIRDVALRYHLEHHVLATYTEWQSGATAHGRARNARLSTVLLARAKPFCWLHVHETWLPNQPGEA